MKALRLALALTPFLFSLAPAAEPSAENAQRAEAACLLAYGALPADSGPLAFAPAAASSVAKLLEEGRQKIQADPALQQAVVRAAYRDVLGRVPSETELRAEAASARTYCEIAQACVKTLAADPHAYAEVLNRAYQLVLRRDIYPSEIAYWKNHDTFAYAFVAASLEGWARRNQPGLMETSGDPTVSAASDFLVTVRLSPSVAAEAFAAGKLRPPSEAPDPFAAGRNVVAPGAADAISLGHLCFAAAGSPALLPAPSHP